MTFLPILIMATCKIKIKDTATAKSFMHASVQVASLPEICEDCNMRCLTAGQKIVDLEALVKTNVIMLADLAQKWDLKHGLMHQAGQEAGDEQETVYRATVQKCILPESYLEPCIVRSLLFFIHASMANCVICSFKLTSVSFTCQIHTLWLQVCIFGVELK